ncbi:SDR family NAD(P)-dependent oxidoreductase [Zavarzinia sp. CC-PAN008]|uniref:SDR family NAD(P)-dependent oxidoreductase n=1 Tax=Zavarzinia sp. CC-PAN008 TaxID=3243332 RepID=UPI003F749D03
MSEQKRTAIVTGSATGLGAAIARQLAQRGIRVAINYSKSVDAAKATAAACESAGVETLLVQADVSQDADCRRLVATVTEQWGRLDYLVNNAGTTKFVEHADLDGLSAEDFQRIYGVNVIGPFQMIRAARQALAATGDAAVVNVSSIAAIMAVGSSVAYLASKGALNTMTLALARALGPQIRVNAICPGFIQGEWLREGLGADRYDMTKAIIEQTSPLRRAGTPEEIAQTAIYLLLDAKLVTGETIMVDSGVHLGAQITAPKP